MYCLKVLAIQSKRKGGRRSLIMHALQSCPASIILTLTLTHLWGADLHEELDWRVLAIGILDNPSIHLERMS
jgi:hypothetical protein